MQPRAFLADSVVQCASLCATRRIDAPNEDSFVTVSRLKHPNSSLSSARAVANWPWLTTCAKIVVFKPPGTNELRRNVDMSRRWFIAGSKALPSLNHSSSMSLDDAMEFLLAEGTDFSSGPWPLTRPIDRLFFRPLSSLMATGQIRRGDCIRVTRSEGCRASCRVAAFPGSL